MGKKYIIELEDENYHQYSDSEPSDYLWRVKGFNALVFDKVGISKLTPYTEPNLEQVRKEAYEDGYKTAKVQCNIQAEKDLREVGERHYQKGLSDAWEAARKIIRMPEVDLLNLFTECYSAVCTSLQVFLKYDASECIEKIRQYEQEKEEQMQVGDEVKCIKAKWKSIITKIGEDGYLTLMDNKGAIANCYDKKDFIKTGRHFSEIAEVLEKMRGEQDG